MPPPRKLHLHCPSEHDIASKRTAQRMSISSAQVALGNIKSLVARNQGPVLSSTLAQGRVGRVSRPRGGTASLKLHETDFASHRPIKSLYTREPRQLSTNHISQNGRNHPAHSTHTDRGHSTQTTHSTHHIRAPRLEAGLGDGE